MSSDDLWIGMDVTPAPTRTSVGVNPFDANDSPELHAAWERQRAQEEAEERAIREQQAVAAATREQVIRLRARRAAEEILRAEQAEQLTIPTPTPLPDLLAEPDTPTAYLIDQLWPAGGNVILAAAYKAGKTTLMANLVRSLADGDPFLDVWPVAHVDGTIGLIDLEMPRDRFKVWLRDQNIRHPEKVVAWTMRGQAGAFDICNPDTRAHWADLLASHNIHVLIIDCLGPILSALGHDEDNKGVGPVLDALTTLAHDAGVQGLMLVHHMGHHAERARGASRLRDWPDAEWRIVRQRDPDNPTAEPPPNAPRFFAAFGRDVDIPEGQLCYTPTSRRLAYAEGSRRDVRGRDTQRAVLEFVAGQPGKSSRAIEAAVCSGSELTRAAVREALAAAVAHGYITVVNGPHRARLHHITQDGRIRLQLLNGEIDRWPDPEPPDPEADEPMVQCPMCFAPHSGPEGTLCNRCEKEV